jgi:DNA repair exonuclease SbcCD ATPase subunit
VRRDRERLEAEADELRRENERLKAVLAEVWGTCCPDCGPYEYEKFAKLLSELIHRAETQ